MQEIVRITDLTLKLLMVVKKDRVSFERYLSFIFSWNS